MQSSISISVDSISINFELQQHLSDVQVPPQSSNMQSTTAELGLGINAYVMFTKQLYNIVMALVAGIVQWTPIIKALPVYFYRVVILPLLNYAFCLVVHAFFAVMSQALVVLVYVRPEALPV